MPFSIDFTQIAAAHVQAFRKYDQQIILEAIEKQLRHEPMTETRNKKRLGENDLSDWEMRIQEFRVFYDVTVEPEGSVVKTKGVGYKEHNK